MLIDTSTGNVIDYHQTLDEAVAAIKQGILEDAPGWIDVMIWNPDLDRLKDPE